MSTMAVVPPYGDSRSETLIPCRTASWPTTNRPSWSLLARSNSGGLARRALISASSAGGQAEPAVLDLHREAVADRVGPDLHPGVGRGERGGVLDQLGDQVDHVVHRRADHRVPRLAGHVHPDVVLHLGDRGAQHVEDGHRVAPAPSRGRAGQDDQAFGVPAHAGGQVVQAEQVGQRAGLVGGPLHRVEHAELAVQQRLVAQRQVEEDLVDALAQVGLADGRLDRGALHGGERLRHRGDLGDLPGRAAVATRPPRPPRRRRAAARSTRGSRSLAMTPAPSCRPVSSLRMLRPKRTATKAETTTAIRPRPPARTSWVTRLSPSRADWAPRTVPSWLSGACSAGANPSPTCAKACGFTGIGRLGGLFSILVSIARSWR